MDAIMQGAEILQHAQKESSILENVHSILQDHIQALETVFCLHTDHWCWGTFVIMLEFNFNLPDIFIYYNVFLFAESPVRFCIINFSLPLYYIIVSGRKRISRLLSKMH